MWGSAKSCTAEAEGEIEQPQQCSLCFAPGTPIHTNHGDVPIENIEIGDQVLSQDQKTGRTEYRPVTALTRPHLDQLLEIRIEGEADPLRPSTGHPFWVRRDGEDAGQWIAAGHLRRGGNPVLRGPQGQPYEIIRALTEEGELIEFHHHCWGHTFPDEPRFEGPHYHGPNGEHIFY